MSSPTADMVSDSSEDEEEPLLGDSSQASRLSNKARISLICVCLIRILGIFSLTVIQTYLYFTCKDLLKYSPSTALAIPLVFDSVLYISSMVGGLVADVKLGCYQVTFLSCCLLLLGQTVSYVIYSINKYQDHAVLVKVVHMLGILFIAIGQGLCDVALLPLGMKHMFSGPIDRELCKRRQQMYLQWFCSTWSVGQFLAVIYLGIAIDRMPRPMRLFVTSMPLWATGLMTFVLIIGKRFYAADNIPLGQRSLQKIIQAVIRRYRGLDVDENQVLLLRFFVFTLVAFSTLSAFLATFFQADGTYLHQLRNLTNSSDDVISHAKLIRNVSLFKPAFVVATIVVLALYGRCAYMCLHWHRVCIGIFFATLSVTCAHVVQAYIDRVFVLDHTLDYLWLIPQYSFLGIGEAFYFVGGYEMCYALSIKGLETMSLGLFIGVGSLFGLVLYTGFVTSGEGHSLFLELYNTLWLLDIVTLALFMYLMIKCIETREKISDDDDEEDDETQEPDDRERSSPSWLEDSSDSISSRERPVRIWENF